VSRRAGVGRVRSLAILSILRDGSIVVLCLRTIDVLGSKRLLSAAGLIPCNTFGRRPNPSSPIVIRANSIGSYSKISGVNARSRAGEARRGALLAHRNPRNQNVFTQNAFVAWFRKYSISWPIDCPPLYFSSEYRSTVRISIECLWRPQAASSCRIFFPTY
jgi:hypothetical protein